MKLSSSNSNEQVQLLVLGKKEEKVEKLNIKHAVFMYLEH